MFSTCTCTGPQSIQCFAQLPPPVVKICTDGQLNIKKPGEVWLEDPRTNCTCTRNNFVLCEILREPVCLDVSGKFRTNLETWSNGSCVECACVNGSINCNRYDVNISYGLYSVILFPLCEQCIVPSQTALALSACKGGYQTQLQWLLLQLSLQSNILCLKKHTNEARGSIQSRIDPFASFVCQTADNFNNSYCTLAANANVACGDIFGQLSVILGLSETRTVSKMYENIFALFDQDNYRNNLTKILKYILSWVIN